jgi:hypothetical protein
MNKIEKMVLELDVANQLNGLNQFPQSFYTNLNDKERAEVVKIYRERYVNVKKVKRVVGV